MADVNQVIAVMSACFLGKMCGKATSPGCSSVGVSALACRKECG